MMDAARELECAEREVRVTRQRLAATMHEIQDRLNPRVLMREAWSELRERGDVLAGEAIDVARKRPAAVVGVAAAVTALLLRHPLGRTAARLFFTRGETEPANGKLNGPNPPGAPGRRRNPPADSEQGD